MSDQRLTDEEAAALRAIVVAKLQLWDATENAEKLLSRELNPESDALGELCIWLNTPAEAAGLNEQQLIEAFELPL